MGQHRPLPESGSPKRAGRRIHTSGPPTAIDEDVVKTAPFAVHRNPRAGPFQRISTGEGRELIRPDRYP